MTYHTSRKPQPTAQERMERKRQAKEQPSKDYYLAQKAKALSYDYAGIPEQHRELVQRAALDIRARLKRTVEDMIEIGRQLNEVQELLPSRLFYEWAQVEFGMSRGSVFEFSRIALRFGGEKRSMIEHIFSPTIVRRLAAVSVPDEAVEQVIAQAMASGKPMRVREAMAIVKPFLPATAPKQIGANPRRVAGLISAAAEPVPEPDDAIDAEYTIIAPMPPPLSFADWLAAMPPDLSLREHLAILELAKGSATRIRSVWPSLYNAVSNVMMLWSRLITAVEQELKNDGE